MRIITQDLSILLPKANESNIVLFTANAYISVKGELVMGRGFARDVKNWSMRKEGFNKIGQQLALYINHLKTYGVVILPSYIGAFQVKTNFNEPASLDLIRNSALMLKAYADKYRTSTYHCNYPGVGFGQLPPKDVHDLLTSLQLPDNIVFYKQ